MKQKLSDIYELQMGKTPARKEPAYWNGNNMWVSISDLSANGKFVKGTKECITDAGVKDSGIKIVPKGTLMMSFKLSLGKVAVADCDLYTNEAIMSFIDKGDYEVYRDYMYYQLQAIDWSLYTNKAVKGATLNKGTLSDVLVKIPKIEEQKTVAGKLEKVDRLIGNLNRQNELVEESIKSRFIEMFGDPVTNPMGWERIRLADKCEIVTGNTPSRKVKEYYGNDIEWIKSDNITEATNLTTATEYLSDEGAKVGRIVEAGSILMTCIAGSLRSIGNVAIADRAVAFNQQINAILPNEQSTYFMYEQFRLSKEYICSGVNMALKGILSKGQLSEIEFIFPPVELQKQFADFVSITDKSKLTIQKSMDNLQELRNSLLQEYFG